MPNIDREDYILEKIKYWERQLANVQGSRHRTSRNYWNNYSPTFDRRTFTQTMRARGRNW